MDGMTKNFVITGVSSGFGRAFAEAALAAGHTVVGTVRRSADAAAFEARADERPRSASFAAATGGGLLAVVSFLNGVPTILRAVLSIDSQTAGAINATVTAVSLAVIAVCAVVIVRRTRQR